MRLLFTFLFLLLSLMTVHAKIVEKEITGNKKVVSFYVTANPTVSESTITYREKKREIKTPKASAPLETTAEKKVKLLLGATALFLAVVGMWSSVKSFIVSFVQTQREGFGLKVITGTFTFLVSLAVLFYALNLLKESF